VNPPGVAEAHAELEAIDRDLKTVGHRLEWLERYVNEARELEAENAKLEKRKQQLTSREGQT
jgi:hypothetical protein